MGLIRNAAASTLARDAIVLDLGDLQRQGEALKRRAQEEANRILTEARLERERLMQGAAEEARAQGLAEGRAQGLEEGRTEGQAAAIEERRAELDALIAAWTAALNDFNGRRERLFSDARTDVLRLALRIAEKVTRRVVECDPRVVADQMNAVLAAVARPTRLMVHIHPEDAAVAREILPGVTAAMGQHAELVEDDSLTRGSCIARTEEGASVDAGIETQLRRIAEALLPGHALDGPCTPDEASPGGSEPEGADGS